MFLISPQVLPLSGSDFPLWPRLSGGGPSPQMSAESCSDVSSNVSAVGRTILETKDQVQFWVQCFHNICFIYIIIYLFF